MSKVIRSAPKTGNELPALRVCKTSEAEIEAEIPALVEITVREVEETRPADSTLPPANLALVPDLEPTCTSINPRFLKSWGRGREKIDLSPGLTGRGQVWRH